MTLSREPVWTLDELSARVALSLSVGYEGQASGRVREVPDRRTIRYYTTLGLLDRPTLRGRTAFYSRRHLAQLVALKRLQARGLSLAEAQARLLGLTDRKLAELAQLPADGEDTPPAGETVEAGRRRQAFWAAARHALGDAAGTRELIEVLLLHRHLRREEVMAGLRAATAAGAVRADVVAVETRRLLDQRPESGRYRGADFAVTEVST